MSILSQVATIVNQIENITDDRLIGILAEHGINGGDPAIWRTMIRNYTSRRKSKGRRSRAPLYGGPTNKRKQERACQKALAVSVDRHNDNDRLARTNALDTMSAPGMDEIADENFGRMSVQAQAAMQETWEASNPDPSW